jgi:LAO/AO transport system kinase
MTRGDTGEGVEELKETIEKHRAHLKQSGQFEKRRRSALRDLVVTWAADRLQREMRHRLGSEDTELMERVYSRELDPISASERIFKAVGDAATRDTDFG